MKQKNAQKHSQQDKLLFAPEDARWATPEIIADYRAERLKCRTMADLCCGIGFQAFSFAKHCETVYAVEIDREKLELAEKNAGILGIKNIKFLQGDVLDEKIISQLKDCDIIFCDPERPASEKERDLDSIKPKIKQLIERYSKITGRIALEIPPQTQNVSLDCEREYISLNGKLNRLTLYFGGLKKSGCSAVCLPARAVLQGEKSFLEKNNKKLLKYLYEVDPAVQKAGLAHVLLQNTGAEFCCEDKALFFTSDSLVENDFFKNTFEVAGICDFDAKMIKNLLEKCGAGSAELRYTVEPQDYWKIRKEFERGLKGLRKAFIFRIEKDAVVAFAI